MTKRMLEDAPDPFNLREATKQGIYWKDKIMSKYIVKNRYEMRLSKPQRLAILLNEERHMFRTMMIKTKRR